MLLFQPGLDDCVVLDGAPAAFAVQSAEARSRQFLSAGVQHRSFLQTNNQLQNYGGETP